jgi:cell division protein ZapE
MPASQLQTLIAQSGLQPDAQQQTVLIHLETLLQRLAATPPSRNWLGRRKLRAVPGLYLWGGVGRGKTWLMDLFYEAVPGQDKLRLHFHRFMQQVHERLSSLQQQKDPLRRIARQFAADCRIICLDEFHVTDIGDAMILAGLLHALFEEGVTLVTTANQPPDRLYLGGIQRASFLPAIDLLKRHTRVVELAGDVDYRRQVAESAGIYHWPLNADSTASLAAAFERLATEPVETAGTVRIMSRDIPFLRRAGGLVWFDFEALCGPPRSQRDYIEVARQHHTVFISDIPRLDGSRDDPSRRLVMLIDEFYDRRVKVILSADAPPERLYCGERLAFDFQRTASRLQEMQTKDYLAQPHRG